MECKEIARLVFHISLYAATGIASVVIIWFVVRVIFLVKKCNMAIEDALDTAEKALIGFCQKLEKLSLKIQKAQFASVNPEFSVYMQYYELRFKYWLHKIGLL